LAQIAFIEGDYSRQKNLLDQALSLEPNNVEVLIALGNYHYFNENNSLAKELYTKANGIEKTATGLGYLGRIEYLEDNLETADLLLSQAITLDPVNPLFYQTRHLVYRDQEKYRSSLNDISKAISLFPSDPWLYLDRARLYWQDWKQPEKSAPDLQKALELDPDNSLALSLLAETNLLTGDVQGSYRAFKAIMERDLQQDKAYPKVSLLAFAIGEYQEARDLIKDYISLYPREIAFPLISAISDIALGNTRRASETLAKAKREHPIDSLEFHTLDYIQNPGSDFSFRNAFAQSQNQALKSRVKFYVGMFQRVSGIETLAQSNFEESVALIDRGVLERSIAMYLLDDSL
jgi:tetratricopeptide (TPR) repeat protein